MESSVTLVLKKQKYVEDVRNRKVFLNLKKIKKPSVEKSQGEANVRIAAVGKNLCLQKIEKNLKKHIHRHP